MNFTVTLVAVVGMLIAYTIGVAFGYLCCKRLIMQNLKDIDRMAEGLRKPCPTCGQLMVEIEHD